MAAYIGHRADILELLNALRKYIDVTLFVNDKDANEYKVLLASFDVSIISVSTQRTYRNKLVDRAFEYFGKIPKSEYNYYMAKTTSTYSGHYTEVQRQELQTRINRSKRIPKLATYDQYLSCLDTSSVSDDHYDAFVSFTPVYNQVVWAKMLSSDIPCLQYVYSWDHSCKFKDFSQRVKRYVTWDEDIIEDLHELQHISEAQCSAVGSSQFAIVSEYLASEHTFDLPTVRPYVYFGCSTGYPKLADAEVHGIKLIAKAMAEAVPGLTLVVRTYPFLESSDTYRSLKSCDNIVLDQLADYKRLAASYRDNSLRKLHITQHATAFVHFGTTLGIEAALVGTPTILCDFGKAEVGAALHDFVHQYQNDKYLNRKGTASTASNINELMTTLRSLHGGKTLTFVANQEITARTSLKSVDFLASELYNNILSVTNESV